MSSHSVRHISCHQGRMIAVLHPSDVGLLRLGADALHQRHCTFWPCFTAGPASMLDVSCQAGQDFGS